MAARMKIRKDDMVKVISGQGPRQDGPRAAHRARSRARLR